MIQPSRVLPSNAPPLRDDDTDDVNESSRILQEHSGSRQHGDAVFSNDIDFKYPAADSDENICVVAPAFYQPQPLPFVPLLPPFQQGLRLGYAHVGRRYPGPEEEARIRADAERLYHHICMTEGHTKYREKQRIAKGSKGKKQIWPTHIEKAFCRGP